MRVLIIGAGSIGLLFGSYLSQTQGNVTYITRSKDQSTLIKTEGVSFYPNEGEPLFFTPEAYSIDEFEQFSKQHHQLIDIDFVLVTVKQTQLDEALPLLKKIVPMNKPLLFMMNGLGHVEKAKEHLPQHSLYFGITQNGAARMAPNQVEERGRGITKIGQYPLLNPHSQHTVENPFLPLIEQCNQFGIRMSWSEEIEIELIRKCIVNACINPLTALFNVKNGHLLTEPRLHQWMHQLYIEIETLIKKTRAKDAEKILLKGELWQEIKTICRNTSQNYSSMVQDIQHGRKTEIEAINGYFLDQARKIDSKLPNHKVLYEAIHILQKNPTKR